VLLKQHANRLKRRNGRIIALLVLAGVLLIGFIASQILKPKTATIPPRIYCQRSILAGFCATFCIGASMMIMVYYLPIYFVSGFPKFPIYLLLECLLAHVLTGIGWCSKLSKESMPLILVRVFLRCIGLDPQRSTSALLTCPY
jgi:hypothetical protein